MLMVDLARYKAMMMANPTATSAAATVRAKKTKTCPATSWKILRKGDEVDIRRVQHQFDRQQDDDDVPTKEDSDDSGQEHDAAQHQVVGQWDSWSLIYAGLSPMSFLARMIAPIIATSRIKDATSNGNK